MSDKDTIYRQAAIDALCTMECGDDSEYCTKRTCSTFTTLMRLPAAPVREVKRGKKIVWDSEDGLPIYICSECKSPVSYWFDYCPSCGADMREVD